MLFSEEPFQEGGYLDLGKVPNRLVLSNNSTFHR